MQEPAKIKFDLQLRNSYKYCQDFCGCM